MIAIPTSENATPAQSQIVGRNPSTSQSQISATEM